MRRGPRLQPVDKVEDLGHRVVQLLGDVLAHVHPQERVRQRHVAQRGHVRLAGNRLDALGLEVDALGQHPGRRVLVAVVLEGHRHVVGVGDDDVGVLDGLHLRPLHDLLVHLLAVRLVVRVAFALLVLLLDVVLRHHHFLHEGLALPPDVENGEEQEHERHAGADAVDHLPHHRQQARGVHAHRLDQHVEHVPHHAEDDVGRDADFHQVLDHLHHGLLGEDVLDALDGVELLELGDQRIHGEERPHLEKLHQPRDDRPTRDDGGREEQHRVHRHRHRVGGGPRQLLWLRDVLEREEEERLQLLDDRVPHALHGTQAHEEDEDTCQVLALPDLPFLPGVIELLLTRFLCFLVGHDGSGSGQQVHGAKEELEHVDELRLEPSDEHVQGQRRDEHRHHGLDGHGDEEDLKVGRDAVDGAHGQVREEGGQHLRRGQREADRQQVGEGTADHFEEGPGPLAELREAVERDDGEAVRQGRDDDVVAVQREEQHHGQLHLEAGEERHLLAQLGHVELGVVTARHGVDQGARHPRRIEDDVDDERQRDADEDLLEQQRDVGQRAGGQRPHPVRHRGEEHQRQGDAHAHAHLGRNHLAPQERGEDEHGHDPAHQQPYREDHQR
ncbi:200 kDa antigen p200, putative [Stigmatella aurantiaca DW4/3-1]|uniref:200 kDa antigen p200, putative n=1 Tax=Stigmatella aurantiaca (strain DW4/3-1) TaxID=378806 RepID=Q08UP2_STIAD|nr:200 kDa antigen p200, putative [Stigmatella aurantiaca DW4/3-1]